ncbi:MAG: peroxidase family protein [Bacteroidota bacterium]
MKKIYTQSFALFFLLSISYLAHSQVNRSIDGRNNNLANPEWGAANTPLSRFTNVGYSDGISAPGGVNRPNPRTISNELFAQVDFLNDPRGMSDFTWVFGQFLDHDITFVLDNEEDASIPIPAGDPQFDPFGTGQVQIGMHRSAVAPGTGTSTRNPRNHTNIITAFIDASAVYGSEIEHANWLRTFRDGKMKVSQGNMLPFNTFNGEFEGTIDPNAPHMDDPIGLTEKLFVAGDARANENPLLLAYHTLFVREHNRLCDELRIQNPSWNDEELYQYARKIVGGLLQCIVYNEWLPTMGVELPPYSGYNARVNPSATNVFSAAAFRMGHTLLNGNLLRLDSNGNPIGSGPIELRFAFFNPLLVMEDGIEPFLQGMAAQVQQGMDAKVIDDVRNFLFGPPGAGGMDLVAINIQRGRERGLADFNTIRQNSGLFRYTSFQQINSNPEVYQALENTYGNINDIDPWVGMLAEEPMENSLFGPTILRMMQIQFMLLREGDRYYFENDAALPAERKAAIRNTRMVDIIKRNTGISIMQENVFMADVPNHTCGAVTAIGNVSTVNNAPLEGMEVNLVDVSRDLSARTLADGSFTIENMIACNQYEVKVDANSNDWSQGVSTLDALRVNWHITNERSLASPYEQIAGDVDNSGSLTTSDVLEIRDLLLEKQGQFATEQPWRFVDADYVFNRPNNPLQEDFESIATTNRNYDDLEILGIKVGDTDNSVMTASNNATANLRVRHIPGNRSHQVEFYFDRTMNIQGLQFDLNYDKRRMRLIRVRTNLPGFGSDNLSFDPTTASLKTSWMNLNDYNGTTIPAGTAVATLSFVGNNVSPCYNISFSEEDMRAEIYEDGKAFNLVLDCDSNVANNSNRPAQLHQNDPNPFEEVTIVRFDLPERMTASLSFVSNRGQVLHTIERTFEAGENQVTINRSMLGNYRGAIFYYLKGEGVDLVKRMVVE